MMHGKKDIMSKPYVVAFANQKGGVGKTTSCVNIASCAAEKGFRVLLIDSDPQGNSSSGVGVAKRQLEMTTYDALIDDAKPEEVVRKTAFSNLYVGPSTITLAGAEFELVDMKRREAKMKAFIEKCEGYDLIVIDCPPSLSMLTINALTAADGVIIPMQCEYYALEGLTQLMGTIKRVKEMYNPGLSVLGIIITMFNGRLNLSTAVLGELKKYYKDKLFNTAVPRLVRISEAPGFGEPINYHDKYSKASEVYMKLTDEIIARIGLKPEKSNKE